MYEHFIETNDCGFSVEILQVTRPGEDTLGLEELWIHSLLPRLNGPGDLRASQALDNMYMKDMLDKLGKK